MPENKYDDIREWLREIATEAERTDQFAALREFRSAHPGSPVPDELEFAARYAQLLGEDKPPETYEAELAREIDKLVAEDDRSKGGGQYSQEQLAAFERIDHLRAADPEIRIEDAAARVLDENYDEDQSSCSPDNDLVGNLVRSYHRNKASQILDQIGEAIRDADEVAGTALLREYLRRVERSRNHHAAQKK